jgi:hypothetical protein
VEQTPTLDITNTLTSTPISDIYEQGIHLFDYDAKSPVDVTETSVEQGNGFTVHDIHFASPKTGEVPAYLIVPDAPGPFAPLS